MFYMWETFPFRFRDDLDNGIPVPYSRAKPWYLLREQLSEVHNIYGSKHVLEESSDFI